MDMQASWLAAALALLLGSGPSRAAQLQTGLPARGLTGWVGPCPLAVPALRWEPLQAGAGLTLSPLSALPPLSPVPLVHGPSAPQVTAPVVQPEEALPSSIASLSDLEDRRARAEPGAQAQALTLSSFWDGSQPKPQVGPDLAAPFSRPAAPASVLEPAKALAAPADPGQAVTAPGSIFDWKPVEGSPGHGLAPLDRLVRRILGHKPKGLAAGFELSDPAPAVRKSVRPAPAELPIPPARVFLYGERHTDKALIRENMRRLAGHMRPGEGAVVLDEAYFGPTLFGSEALRYLEAKGLDAGWLAEDSIAGLSVAGWDDKAVYDESKHPLLQHHMNLYYLNQALYGPQRGWRYYTDLARQAAAALRNWLVLRRLAIQRRNSELDRSLAAVLADAARNGRSVHLIAGGEHLVEKPWWKEAPFFGRVRLRRGLIRVLGGAPYWAGMPADSLSD